MNAWYYAQNGKTVGPFSETQLIDLIRQAQIARDTLIATEAGDWSPAGSSSFAGYFPPPPPPSSQTTSKQKKGGGMAVGWSIALMLVCAFLIRQCATSTPTSSIERVLNECTKLAAYVNKDAGRRYEERARYLAAKMQQIDTRKCPEDFRMAFQRHINAWSEAAPYLGANTNENLFLEGLAAGFSGDSSYIGQSATAAQIATENINSTYYALVETAIRHGAKIPRSSVD